MGLWDNEAFRDKHDDEWREYDYYDRHGWPEQEDDVSPQLEPTTDALLDALENVSEEFWDCIMLTQIYDYLVDMWEYFHNSTHTSGDFGSGLSEVEYAQSVLDCLIPFSEAVAITLDDAPRFSREFSLEDVEEYTNRGIDEMQRIIAEGGIA